MKTKLLVLLLAVSYFSSSFAAVHPDEQMKTYTFTFKTIHEPIQLKANTYEEAYEKAAFNCMAKLKGSSQKLSEDQKMDLIDVCANPKAS